jgi:hypothetical protein
MTEQMATTDRYPSPSPSPAPRERKSAGKHASSTRRPLTTSPGRATTKEDLRRPHPCRSATPTTPAAVNPHRHTAANPTRAAVAAARHRPPSHHQTTSFLRAGPRSGQGVVGYGATTPAAAGGRPEPANLADGAERPRPPRPAREERRTATPPPSSRPRGIPAASSGGGAAGGGEGGCGGARVRRSAPSPREGDASRTRACFFLFPTVSAKMCIWHPDSS